VRGQVIGVLDAFRPAPEQAGPAGWTDDEVALLEALAEQLGAALDGARLYEETQRRAGQERLAAEITGRIRESLDIETVLKTAAQEVRLALNAPEVIVQLVSPPSEQSPAGGNGHAREA